MRARRLAIIGAGLLTLVLAGQGEAEKPEHKPKPRLELRTQTQEAVLRNGAIKVTVTSKRGKKARVKARLVVEGFPDDYSFKLGPESRRLRKREAKLKLPLSARQDEVLAFAEQACDGATVSLEASAGHSKARLAASLPPKSCAR